MAWYCSGSSNTELIENLFKVGLIKNERVKEAMLGVGSLPPSRLSKFPPDPKQLTPQSRSIEPTTPRRDLTRIRRSPSDMGPPSPHRTCMATRVSISSSTSAPVHAF